MDGSFNRSQPSVIERSGLASSNPSTMESRRNDVSGRKSPSLLSKLMGRAKKKENRSVLNNLSRSDGMDSRIENTNNLSSKHTKIVKRNRDALAPVPPVRHPVCGDRDEKTQDSTIYRIIWESYIRSKAVQSTKSSSETFLENRDLLAAPGLTRADRSKQRKVDQTPDHNSSILNEKSKFDSFKNSLLYLQSLFIDKPAEAKQALRSFLHKQFKCNLPQYKDLHQKRFRDQQQQEKATGSFRQKPKDNVKQPISRSRAARGIYPKRSAATKNYWKKKKRGASDTGTSHDLSEDDETRTPKKKSGDPGKSKTSSQIPIEQGETSQKRRNVSPGKQKENDKEMAECVEQKPQKNSAFEKHVCGRGRKMVRLRKLEKKAPKRVPKKDPKTGKVRGNFLVQSDASDSDFDPVAITASYGMGVYMEGLLNVFRFCFARSGEGSFEKISEARKLKQLLMKQAFGVTGSRKKESGHECQATSPVLKKRGCQICIFFHFSRLDGWRTETRSGGIFVNRRVVMVQRVGGSIRNRFAKVRCRGQNPRKTSRCQKSIVSPRRSS